MSITIEARVAAPRLTVPLLMEPFTVCACVSKRFAANKRTARVAENNKNRFIIRYFFDGREAYMDVLLYPKALKQFVDVCGLFFGIVVQNRNFKIENTTVFSYYLVADLKHGVVFAF